MTPETNAASTRRDEHEFVALVRCAAHPLTGAIDQCISTATPAVPRSCCGRTTRTSATRARRRWVRGELNVGQLVRERAGAAAVLVGFTTDHGTVTAASDWDQPAERKRVRPALGGSYEALFHAVGLPRFLLTLRNAGEVATRLAAQRLERAIGVVYRPESERASHYFAASLAQQFDAVLHFDETRAVEPLERTVEWEAGEVPETYPSGI